MNLIQIMDLKTGTSIAVFLILFLMTIIQIAPIKVNPWDKILVWFGNHMNADIVKRVDVIEEKLDEHIKDSSEERIRKIRADILDFGNACMNGRPHTKEEFEFVISECDAYENYIHKKNIKNGVATAAIKEIKRLYAIGLQNNSFLRGDGDGN